MKKVAMVIVAICLLFGCVSTMRFTVVSNGKIDIENSNYIVDKKQRVKARGTVSRSFFSAHDMKLAGIDYRPSVTKTIEEAIEKAPGAVGLSDVIITDGSSGFISREYWCEVEGSPVYPKETEFNKSLKDAP